MLNSLNSILVEGTVKDVPILEDGVATFEIESRRVYMDGEDRKVETSVFPIVTRSRLAEVCAEYLKGGRGVRIVGRLQWVPEGAAQIMAEHVEFQPIKAKVAEAVGAV